MIERDEGYEDKDEDKEDNEEGKEGKETKEEMGEERKKNVINELKVGDLFGEITWFNDNMKVTANVTAVSFVTVATITRRKIQDSK